MKKILTVCLNPVIQHTMLFSRFAPGRLNRALVSQMHASGKGINVSRVLCELGSAVLHLTHAGGSLRQPFLDLCAQDGISIEAVDSGSQIRTCVTVLDQNEQQTSELIEEAQAVSAGCDAAIREAYIRLLPESTCVCISGSKAAGYSPDIYPWMTERAIKAGVPVLLDIRGPELLAALSYRPQWIKPNLDEFCETWGIPDSKDRLDKALALGQKINTDYGTGVIITLGSDGAVLIHNGKVVRYSALQVNAKNTTGCGDSFAAGLLSVLNKEPMALERAMEAALKTAAANAATIKPGSITAVQSTGF